MVLLCFLKRRVVARESEFACFGGCTSRVNKKCLYSSKSSFFTYHFAGLQTWLGVVACLVQGRPDGREGGESGRD